MRKPVFISLICVLGALALLLWGFNSERPVPVSAEGRFLLLIERDTGAFLMQLRKGMQEAAALRGARLSSQIASLDPAAQAAELANAGLTAVILLLDDPQPMLAALEAAGIPALVAGQTVRGQVCVVSDDAKAGEALISRALSLTEPSRVLFLTDGADARAAERAAGANALLRRHGVRTLAYAPGMAIPGDAGVIVAASVRATLWLLEAKESGAIAEECLILGADIGDDRVWALESGLIHALATDNPYAMGYLSVEKAGALAEGLLSPSLHLCAAPLIDRENMYLSENVKLVFPLLQ